MARLREWIARVWGTLRPGRQDGDLEQELRLHQELAGERGGVAQAVEAMRDQRGLPWLDDFLRDTRHAWRLLLRNPAFTAVAVVRCVAQRERRDVQPGRRAAPASLRSRSDHVTIARTRRTGLPGGGVSS